MISRLVLDLARTVADPAGLAWAPLGPGVDVHRLYQCGADGPSAALVRYRPGAEVPRHAHVGFEHVWVIAGAQHDDDGRYVAGTFVVNPPGSAHRVWSPDGCLVLIVWERPVRFETNHDREGRRP